MAARNGHSAVAEVLLAAKAKVDASDKVGPCDHREGGRWRRGGREGGGAGRTRQDLGGVERESERGRVDEEVGHREREGRRES